MQQCPSPIREPIRGNGIFRCDTLVTRSLLRQTRIWTKNLAKLMSVIQVNIYTYKK